MLIKQFYACIYYLDYFSLGKSEENELCKEFHVVLD